MIDDDDDDDDDAGDDDDDDDDDDDHDHDHDLLCMKIMNGKVSNVHALDSLRIVVNSLRWTYILCDSWCISYWIDPFQFVRSSMFSLW